MAIGIGSTWGDDIDAQDQRDLGTGKKAIDILRRLVNHPEDLYDKYSRDGREGCDIWTSPELYKIVIDAQTLVSKWDEIYHI